MRMVITSVVLTAALAGCNESKNYPIPAGQVSSTLLSLRPPMAIFGGGAGSSMVTPTGDNDVRWTILNRQSSPVMSLVAKIDAVGDAETKVTVTAEPAKSNSTAAKAMGENPAIVKLYTKAMTEQIAAKLEKREFNMATIQAEMMAAALATMPKIQNEAMKRAAEFQEMERETRNYTPDRSRPGQPDNPL